MISRALVAVMLVGALLGAPNAAAGPMGLDAELPLLTNVPGDASVLETVGDPVKALDAPALVDAATDLTECAMAVRLPVALFGGNAVDSRDGHLDVLVTAETLVNEVIETVPVYGPVEQVIWQGTGLLSGLPTITRTVTGVVGTEERVVESTVENLDYNVVLDWKETQIAWTQIDLELVLLPSVGLPYVINGLGVLDMVCDQEPLAALPDFRALDGYQYVKVSVGGSDRGDHTGWYTRLLSLDVSLADADDAGKATFASTGLLLCPTDLADRADAGIGDIQDAILRGDIAVPQESVHGEHDAPAIEPSSASGATVGVAPLAALLGTVLLAAAGFALRRRF